MPAKKKPQKNKKTKEETTLLGKAEIPPVAIEKHRQFIDAANKMVEDQNAELEERQRKIDEKELKKTDAADRMSAKKTALREFYAKTGNALKPVTRPLGNRIKAARTRVSMKYEAYAEAKEDRIENENKERLNRLNNAMIPFVFNTKGFSEIEEESQFSFYRVTSQENHGTNFRNYSMDLHEGCGVHYVAVKKPKYEIDENPNVVVMSLWDSGRIEIRGNCDSHKEKMHVEATRRGNPNDNSSMDQMLWDDINRVLLFAAEKKRAYKYRTREPYLGFSRNAESLTGRTKDKVVHKAKVTFFRMLRSQGMYAKQNQPLEFINV